MNYKIRFIDALRRDADLQRSGRLADMGSDFNEIDSLIPADDPLRAIPLIFWDSWLDERNHSFPCFYEGIRKEDWPELADSIATAIERNSTNFSSRLSLAFGIKGEAKAESWQSRLWISVVFFLFLIFVDELQYAGPKSEHLKNYLVIAIGFLMPALSIYRKHLRAKLLISFVSVGLAAFVWMLISEFFKNTLKTSSLLTVLLVAYTSFGVSIFVNELIIKMFENRNRNKSR